MSTPTKVVAVSRERTGLRVVLYLVAAVAALELVAGLMNPAADSAFHGAVVLAVAVAGLAASARD